MVLKLRIQSTGWWTSCRILNDNFVGYIQQIFVTWQFSRVQLKKAGRNYWEIHKKTVGEFNTVAKTGKLKQEPTGELKHTRRRLQSASLVTFVPLRISKIFEYCLRLDDLWLNANVLVVLKWLWVLVVSWHLSQWIYIMNESKWSKLTKFIFWVYQIARREHKKMVVAWNGIVWLNRAQKCRIETVFSGSIE